MPSEKLRNKWIVWIEAPRAQESVRERVQITEGDEQADSVEAKPILGYYGPLQTVKTE